VKQADPLPHFSSENDMKARLIGEDPRRPDTGINQLITCFNAPA